METHLHLPTAAIDLGFFSTKIVDETGSPGQGAMRTDIFDSVAIKCDATLPRLPRTTPLDGAVVKVGQQHFFAGKDVLAMADSTGMVRASHTDFCKSDDYKAIFLASLYYLAKHSKVSGPLSIGTLVLGLPMNTVVQHSKFVEAMAKEEHQVPCPTDPDRSIRVRVNKVLVVAQPQGALIYSNMHRPITAGEISLVLDMGGGTFDWFLCTGWKANWMVSGAAGIGMLACASAVCRAIQPGLENNPVALSKVDTSLRLGTETVRLLGRDIPLAEFASAATGVLRDAIERMRKSVGDLAAVDRILLTGGGATLLQRVLAEVLPDYMGIVEVDKDPVFSNAKGFFLIGKGQTSPTPLTADRAAISV